MQFYSANMFSQHEPITLAPAGKKELPKTLYDR